MSNPEEQILKVAEKIPKEENLPEDLKEALKWYQEAQIMWGQGRSLDALSRYEASLEVFLKHGRFREAANASEKIGDIYFWRGNFQKALKPYKMALDICEEFEDEIGAAIMSEKIVYVFQKTNEPERALPYLYRSLEIAEKYGDAHRAARALVGIGDVNRYKGKLDVALEAYELAHKIYKGMGSREQAELVSNTIQSLRQQMNSGEKPSEGVGEGDS